MKVKTAWLVIPIVLTLVLIGAAVYAMNYFQIEKSDTGYTYKEELFKKDELGTVEVTVSDKNWQTILDDPMAEEYVEASVTINGQTIDNVGIRAKGNSSLMSVASSDSERYSLKISFSQYNNTQTYYGLETLNLNNNFSDSTQMKEFVAYELMEQLGITTPAHSYVKVMVNGEYYGLMLAVEAIEESFATTNYGSTDGFIFKPEGDGSDLKYVSNDKDDYAGIFDEAKTNEETAKNNSNVVEMMKEISEGDTSSIDVDQLARYFALNTAMVNMDSYQGPFKHNYYLREDRNGVFTIIPWDYNMSFGGFSGMGGGPGERNGETDGEAAGQNQEVVQQEGNTQQSAQGETQAPPNAQANGEQGGAQTPPNFQSNGEQGEMQVPPNAQANGEQGGAQTPPNFQGDGEQGEMQAPPNAQGNGKQGGMQAPPNFQGDSEQGRAQAPSNVQSNEEQDGQAQQNAEGASEETGDNAANNRGGGGMMNMMTGQEMLTDNNINFSITEPVSSTTVDERPLLKIILEDEKARALYDGYLEKIATELLTEENILAITEPLEQLLLEAVKEDPSKFTTTEEFLEGVRSEKSIAEFAKQRSESILKQLAGEIEGISGAGSGFGGGGMPGMNGGEMPDFGGEMPDFENMPNFEGGPPNFEDMPDFGNTQGGPPNFGDGQGPPNMQGGQMPGQQAQAATSPVKSLMMIGGSLALCVVALLFILLLGKRKYKRK